MRSDDRNIYNASKHQERGKFQRENRNNFILGEILRAIMEIFCYYAYTNRAVES